MPNMQIHGACAMPSFGTDDSIRTASLSVPLTTRAAWRFLEQQTEEPPLCESQQERAGEPKQQQRVPCCPHASRPESDALRGFRVCMQVSRDVHDEKGSAPVLPVSSGTGAEHTRRDVVQFPCGLLKSMMAVRLP